MYGAIIGDIVGSYYEVLEVNAIKKEPDKKLANEIMNLVQESFDNKMYISVQFES